MSAPTPLSRADPGAESGIFSHWQAMLGIVIVVLVSYLPLLGAGFIWDDDQHITNNPLLLNADGLVKLWTEPRALPQYYPLTHTFFWIEHHLWGNQPLGYHVVNVLVHACNALLIWWILRRLDVPGALFAALLFGVHPINVETVAWVSEGKNTFSLLFYLLSFLAYLRLDRGPTRRPRTMYAASFVLFVCALLCKTVTCTLPLALLILGWWREGRVRAVELLRLSPFLVVGAVLGLYTAFLERTHVASVGRDWTFGEGLPSELTARCLIAGRNVWFYLGKILVPYPLMFEYPRWHISTSVPAQYLFPMALLLMLFSLWLLRHRLGRAPLALALFFIVTLLPALGFVNLYPMRFSLVADHFAYLATVGPIVLVASFVAVMSMRRSGEFIPAEVLVGSMMILTVLRCFVFQNAATVYADSISKNPNGWMTQTNMGDLLLESNDLDGAARHLTMALSLKPDNGPAADKLGLIAFKRGQNDFAIDWFRKAIEIQPDLPSAHFDLARALDKRGDPRDVPEAFKEYQQTLRLRPNHAPAHLNLGILYARAHDGPDAVREIDRALEIGPDTVEALKLFVSALVLDKDYDRAAAELRELINQHPTDPYSYEELGEVEMRRHNNASALAAFTRALDLDPSLSKARLARAALMAQATTHP
jgi:Flp pilus assembly protein TadD